MRILTFLIFLLSSNLFASNFQTHAPTVLIIGCGHIKAGTGALPCPCVRQAAKLGRHLHHGQYVVNLEAGYDSDLVGDIRNEEIISYLEQHQFNIVWFEHTPSELSLNTTLVKRIYRLVVAGGILIMPWVANDLKMLGSERGEAICAEIKCSDFVLEKNGAVYPQAFMSYFWEYFFQWWQLATNLMHDHGPLPSERLPQIIYLK